VSQHLRLLVEVIRNSQGQVARRIADIGEASVCTSVIVTAALRLGAAKRQSKRLATQMKRLLETLEILPFEAPANAAYGDLRSRLEAAGRLIGAMTC
jgi:tRNA(fMet)-specific endonuclease VapC